jgi:hypothetical protein
MTAPARTEDREEEPDDKNVRAIEELARAAADQGQCLIVQHRTGHGEVFLRRKPMEIGG